jgi:hypothetical protein
MADTQIKELWMRNNSGAATIFADLRENLCHSVAISAQCAHVIFSLGAEIRSAESARRDFFRPGAERT